MTVTELIDGKIIEELQARLRALLAEYLRESDPAQWPQLATIPEQQARFWRKKHCHELLKQINALQTMLRNSPRVPSDGDTSETAKLIRDAKATAAAMRERVGLVPRGVQ